MELLNSLLHIDEYLTIVINTFGNYTYIFLFLIIFAETGLVITPFLPGDSLLFAAGALAGGNYLNIIIVYLTILIAATLGDTVNYWLGHKFGNRVFSKNNSKIFKREYLDKTSEFYKKHGGKTIILARFVPIVRTFAPFVAGIGRMHYRTFFSYNIIGAILWTTSLVFAGFFFGRIPLIKDNFEYVVIAIVIISVLPMVFEYLKHKLKPEEKKDKSDNSYKTIEELFKKEHLSD